jgi:zinc/manganese transport system substrate-binding protein
MPALALLLLCLLLLAGCAEGSPSGSDVVVVGTTTQVGDFLREVGGRRADVRQILRPSSDPHDYEPRPSDVKALGAADLVVRSGGEVDEWLDGLVDDAGSDAPVLDLSSVVRTRHRDGELDPHWWQDPRNAERAVAAIRDGLAKADPAGAPTYRRNAAGYLARLARLDGDTAACIDRVPPARRNLVTTHDALGYYADRYGLDVIGAVIPSLSTQAQPSARDVHALVSQIRRTRVRAIYPESSINPELERAVARESGASVGGALWADTLGQPGSSGATYVESVQSNTRAIAAGLSGGALTCPAG